MKNCKCCGEVKPFELFYKSRGTVYASNCKACAKKIAKERYFADLEKNQEKARIYHRENAENISENRKAKYKQNPEKEKERFKVYARANREKEILRTRKNLAESQKNPTWLTDFDVLKIKCLYQVAAMRTRESGQQWHVDHIIPLRGKTVSGLHVPSNLQVITASENRKKHNLFSTI